MRLDALETQCNATKNALETELDALKEATNKEQIAQCERLNAIVGNPTGGIGAQQTITTDADGATSVFAADVDGDGDMDVLSASENDGKIAWYENEDGKGSFGVQQLISPTVLTVAPYSVFAADLDGDGDLDVFFADASSSVSWSKNMRI